MVNDCEVFGIVNNTWEEDTVRAVVNWGGLSGEDLHKYY